MCVYVCIYEDLLFPFIYILNISCVLFNQLKTAKVVIGLIYQFIPGNKKRSQKIYTLSSQFRAVDGNNPCVSCLT